MVQRLRLILASSSIYRRELLNRLGLPFIIRIPNIDETEIDGEIPQDLAVRLALAKAKKVSRKEQNAAVISSDQVAISGGKILRKPGSKERAVATLTFLSGREVCFLTALVVLNTVTGKTHQHLDETHVQFRKLEQSEIRHYVATEEPLDCAAAVKSEGMGITLLERISTQDPTALIGLPLIRLSKFLRAEGFSFD